MRKYACTIVAVLAATIAGWNITPAAAEKETPRVEVVFVLDTTGSMGGLIEGAKLKIWSIANQIVSGTPRPELSVGLVGYRDIGDEYVTRAFDLSTDLDQVYANLMSFVADGGGDTPEHVNRALQEAVDGISWSRDARTLRILFLVGDAPPHTDYADGFDYKTACAAAVTNDIVINTIQCGGMGETTGFWSEIAKLGEGEYAAIEQNGGMRSIPTPMDEEISRLSAELDATVVAFGDAEAQEKAEHDMAAAAEMPAAPRAARACFKTASGVMATYDLVGAWQAGSVELGKIETAHLPEKMRGMSVDQMEEYLAKKKGERDELSRKIVELNQKRDRFIKDKLAETGARDSFDEKVLSMIRARAAEKGLTY